MFVKVGGKWIRLEKNQVVTLTKGKSPASEEAKNKRAVDLHGKQMTFRDFIANGEKAQKGFWLYDGRHNNCQTFQVSLLKGLLTADLRKFIEQDTKSIFNDLPKYVGGLSKAITDFAASLDILQNGKGQIVP